MSENKISEFAESIKGESFRFASESELSEMSSFDVSEIMGNYYSGKMSAKDVIEKNNLKIANSKLTSQFPIIHSQVKCRWCDSAMYIVAPTKSNVINRGIRTVNDSTKLDYQCINCGHKQFTSKRHFLTGTCYCENCEQERKKELDKIKAKKFEEVQRQDRFRELLNELNSNLDKVALDEISLNERLQLAVVIQELGTTDSNRLLPIKTVAEKSGITFDIEIISHFFTRNVLIISPDSEISAFELIENNKNEYQAQSVNITLCSWLINVDGTIDDLKHPLDILRNVSMDEINRMWSEQALNELIRIAEHEIEDMQFVFKTEKMRDAILRWINVFTPSQIYALLWRAVRNANSNRTKNTWGNYSFPKNHTDYVIKLVDDIVNYKNAKNQSFDAYQYPNYLTMQTATNIFFEELVKQKNWFEMLITTIEIDEKVLSYINELSGHVEVFTDLHEYSFLIDNNIGYRIESEGVVVDDGVNEWLFTDIATLKRLAIQNGFTKLSDDTNKLDVCYSIKGAYETGFILGLIEKLKAASTQ
ncbi:hypothetical protein EQG49_09575 [Periweissella cryptocerci]|uniref:Uncharacterized protein n=1 Tax=Periweissella cryptocerci TaxID=2506420 RepID=A0A4P6YVA3_9LACO|nr:hypothetical protein [Periweissella cryptocerci]QBO36691.1 hypothetical protein EQG49_09575 [Periweissella cryptocerci]